MNLTTLALLLMACSFILGWSTASVYHLSKFQKRWDWALKKSKEFDERLKKILRDGGLDS